MTAAGCPAYEGLPVLLELGAGMALKVTAPGSMELYPTRAPSPV